MTQKGNQMKYDMASTLTIDVQVDGDSYEEAVHKFHAVLERAVDLLDSLPGVEATDITVQSGAHNATV